MAAVLSVFVVYAIDWLLDVCVLELRYSVCGFGSLSRVSYILGTWRLRAGAGVFGRSRINPSLAKVSNLIGEGYWINHHNILFRSHSGMSQVAESVL